MIEKLSQNKILMDVVSVLLGTFLTAFAVSCIIVPNNLSTGGYTGLAIVLEKLTGVKYTYVYYIMSFTTLAMALIFLGKKAFLKIITLSIVFPTMLLLTNKMNYTFVSGDSFLVCVYFSLFYGVGGGLVLRRGFTFGGSDTFARILNKRVFKNVNISKMLLIVDAIIILIIGFTFGKDIALYALINHYLYIQVLDYFLFGFRAKLYKVSIISVKYEDISKFIFNNLKRGATIHNVVGAYTNQDKKMVSCICSPEQSAEIRRYLAENDESAFMEVSPIVSVFSTGVRFRALKDIEE